MINRNTQNAHLDALEKYVRDARNLLEPYTRIGSNGELAARQLTFAVQACASLRRAINIGEAS